MIAVWEKKVVILIRLEILMGQMIIYDIYSYRLRAAPIDDIDL